MKIIFAGGGTGGHIYPIISIIKELRKKYDDVEVLFIGSDRGLEAKITSSLNIPFIALDVSGLKRSLSLANFKSGYKFIKSVGEAKKIIKKFDPDVVVGTGGYVSAPVLYEAHCLKIKTMIFEPNSYPGLANRLLGKIVDVIAVTNDDPVKYFPRSKIIVTGNPRSQEVYEESLNVKNPKTIDNIPKVLIFGGSLGAYRINEVTVQMLLEHDIQNFKIIFGTGVRYYDSHSDIIKKINLKNNIEILPYIKDMPNLLPQISLIISRSGATTISEITSLGIPSILIPSPNVTHDHQTYNARSLVDKKAAILLPESDLTSEKLFNDIVDLINDPLLLKRMKESSFAMGQRKAADNFIKELINLSEK